MIRLPAAVRAASLAATVLIGTAAPALAADPLADSEITAYVDGVQIPIRDIPKYFCDDFAYPVITCSRVSLVTVARSTTMSLLGVDYVTIYDKTVYAGAYINLSQDYGALLTIGWNDRVSSFIGRNSETGQFFTDWFNNGSSWPFCCNSQVPSLGGYDNTFSSVQRT